MIGKRYQHYKGGIYEVVELARDANNFMKVLVIYKSEENGNVWARNLEEWDDHVRQSSGDIVKRFTAI